MARTPTIGTNLVYVHELKASRRHADPGSLTLDAIFMAPSGRAMRVPGYWAGGDRWAFRFASSEEGLHMYRTECSATDDRGLHGVSGDLTVTYAPSSNALYRRGPIRVAEDRRHFEHADGTPFFWLADTWWMGFSKRLRWPDEFALLTNDRVSKGFSVVQIVAGIYPDMPPFDPRGANEVGYAWEREYAGINPEYFNKADLRIQHLIAHGIVPCIVGAWGYHMPWMGAEKIKEHWRYVIARWAAYPVVWCVAGEANLPWYLAPGFPYDDREQVTAWTDVARYVRSTDPYRRPMSIHPTGLGELTSHGTIDDASLIDFEMLQTGHGDRASFGPTVDATRKAMAYEPPMPVLNSEVCYEGIIGGSREDVQRLMFWSSVMLGAAGHTYGANGIWQLNEVDRRYGPSPHGGDYGPIPWSDAMHLPGSMQLGRGKRLLETLRWWELKPMTTGVAYVSAHTPRDAYHRPYGASTGDGTVVVYVPEGAPIVVNVADGGWMVKRVDALLPDEPVAPAPMTAVGGVIQVAPPGGAQDWIAVLQRRVEVR